MFSDQNLHIASQNAKEEGETTHHQLGDICVYLLQFSLCTSVEYIHGQWSPLHYFIRPALFVCSNFYFFFTLDTHKQSHWLPLSKFIDNGAHFCFVLNVRFAYTAAHFLVWHSYFHTTLRPYSGCTRRTFSSSPRARNSCVHTLIK